MEVRDDVPGSDGGIALDTDFYTEGGDVIHTVGCKSMKNFATPEWRISCNSYSQQYQNVRNSVVHNVLKFRTDPGLFTELDSEKS